MCSRSSNPKKSPLEQLGYVGWQQLHSVRSSPLRTQPQLPRRQAGTQAILARKASRLSLASIPFHTDSARQRATRDDAMLCAHNAIPETNYFKL
jgi:hypothetical protein